jgi:hypothetical protein
MMNQNFRKVMYIAAVVVAMALIVFIFILGLQSKDKTSAIDVRSAVPTDANVTIDSQKVNSNGKVAVKPGQHTVTAKRNGFSDKIVNVSVKMGETKTVRLLMSPNSEVGRQWLRDHPTAALEFEAQQGQEFNQNSENTTAKNPLISYLPEVHPTWRVDYGASVKSPNDPYAVAIIITYGGSDIDKQNALDWIKSLGLNPDDYEIIYQTPGPSSGG